MTEIVSWVLAVGSVCVLFFMAGSANERWKNQRDLNRLLEEEDKLDRRLES